ncbi:MAG: hypothetical protein ACRCXX_01570 [Cetobacterium sp.]|uniref:hypothetical protein n=1 Tax=Cetobacterium sp. TaxID=2071632 RepID=UPI003F2C4F09
MYEPGEFPFPEGELPATPETTSPFPISPVGIPKEDFQKLTQIPIVLYFGDNIPSEMINNWGQDNWRIRLNEVANILEKWLKETKF